MRRRVKSLIKKLTSVNIVISKHKLATIIAVGIIVRLLLMPIAAHPYDVYAWYTLSLDSLKNASFNVYNFPPLWYNYMLFPISHLYDWLAKFIPTGTIPMASLPSALNFYPSLNIEYVPGMLFNTVVKLPFLFSDTLIALLLYKIVKESSLNVGLAEKAALLWFLNPFVIWISAGWGMWDTMPAMFSLASFYLLWRKKVTLSAISLSLGVASKLYPLLFIVPAMIYMLKSNSFEEKRKVVPKFLAVFLISSTILFIPYLSLAANFFSSYFIANPASTNPIANPLGFGLTYWSLFLLSRFTITANTTLTEIVPLVSIALVTICLVLVYWRTSKITFTKPTVDLVTVFILPILMLFLSYRIIPEQWFIWTLPFLVILYAGKKVKGIYYWVASFVALLYAILNCPLPFFFLPLAPWYTKTLLGLVYAFWEIDFQRILLLIFLGTIFSILMLIILFKLTKISFTLRRKTT